MCGRFTIASSPRRLASAFGAEPDEDLEEGFPRRFNVAPTDEVLGVTEEHGRRLLGRFSWGLVPSWAKDRAMAARSFNARAESVATKPAFRHAFRARRCLVPADPGFYEWSHDPAERKAPYLFLRSDGEPMALAGLWEPWRAGRGEPWTRSLTVITAAAGPDVAPVHERQPVVLERDRWDRWLDPELQDAEELQALLEPSLPGILRRHRVSRAVGKAANDVPELLDEVEDDPAPAGRAR